MTRYFDGGKPNRIEVAGNFIYMTDQENGLVILHMEESGETTSSGTSSDGFIMSLEALLLVGGLSVIIVIFWRLKK